MLQGRWVINQIYQSVNHENYIAECLKQVLHQPRNLFQKGIPAARFESSSTSESDKILGVEAFENQSSLCQILPKLQHPP